MLEHTKRQVKVFFLSTEMRLYFLMFLLKLIFWIFTLPLSRFLSYSDRILVRFQLGKLNFY